MNDEDRVRSALRRPHGNDHRWCAPAYCVTARRVLLRECDVCSEAAVEQCPDGEVLCEGHVRMRLAAVGVL